MIDSETQSLPHDVAFDVLSNARRRFILRQLQSEPSGLELGEIAAELAAVENGAPVEELSRQDRKRIYVSLYQTHIPKLEDVGIIDYDTETGLVRPTDRLDELALYFNRTTDDTSYEPLYLGVAIAGLALLASTNLVDTPLMDPVLVSSVVLATIAFLNLVLYVQEDADQPDATIPVEME